MKIRTITALAFLGTITFFSSFIFQHPYEPDRTEAEKAFSHLNEIRSNPGHYSKEIGANLKKISSQPQLIWNDTLARVAEAKALDMIKRNYDGHITPEGYGINYMIDTAGYALEPDWLKDPKSNYFESWQAGAENGSQMIRDLILDEYDKNLGHRKHLLGMGEWNEKLVDIGIAFVPSPGKKYRSHSIVIIARHEW